LRLENDELLHFQVFNPNFDLGTVAVNLFFASRGVEVGCHMSPERRGLPPGSITHAIRKFSIRSMARRGVKFYWPLVQFLRERVD
jgi:hypothetical protein